VCKGLHGWSEVRWGEMKLGGVGCGDLRDDMGKGDTMWVG